MAYVVALQGFKQSGRDFVLEELAVLSLDPYDNEHLVRSFKPLFSWRRITEKYKKEFPYITIDDTICETLGKARGIFVSDSANQNWLRRFRLSVCDTDLLGYGNVKQRKFVAICPHHDESFKVTCALLNV